MSQQAAGKLAGGRNRVCLDTVDGIEARDAVGHGRCEERLTRNDVLNQITIKNRTLEGGGGASNL